MTLPFVPVALVVMPIVIMPIVIMPVVIMPVVIMPVVIMPVVIMAVVAMIFLAMRVLAVIWVVVTRRSGIELARALANPPLPVGRPPRSRAVACAVRRLVGHLRHVSPLPHPGPTAGPQTG
ncbi:hypothetical protein [Aquabacter sediminis]|uniref:hypothetical protein n=1 Tax=Aquabacter sediminis TaxID=3029197 RepID=UPI00237E1E50|nr:hypothetical protein [Aquabacter sp. P-9]MDE1571088.1 hypothetical protein [Aquabacter sp. P-9]